MNILDWMQRFSMLNQLILSEEAVSLKIIGEKMSISPSQVRYLIKVMKRNGAPIEYDKNQRRYIYTKSGFFEAKFEYIFPGKAKQ